MKDLNWNDCFEPAPEAFEASVRHALQTKMEDKHMKRMIPRSAAKYRFRSRTSAWNTPAPAS